MLTTEQDALAEWVGRLQSALACPGARAAGRIKQRVDARGPHTLTAVAIRPVQRRAARRAERSSRRAAANNERQRAAAAQAIAAEALAALAAAITRSGGDAGAGLRLEPLRRQWPGSGLHVVTLFLRNTNIEQLSDGIEVISFCNLWSL